MKQQRYYTGEDIHAGDLVRFSEVPTTIVFVNDSGEYLPGFSATEWDYLGTGFMMRQENGALIYLPEADEDVVFEQRA